MSAPVRARRRPRRRARLLRRRGQRRPRLGDSRRHLSPRLEPLPDDPPDPRSYDVDTDAPLPQTAYSVPSPSDPGTASSSADASAASPGAAWGVKCWASRRTLRLALKGRDGPSAPWPPSTPRKHESSQVRATPPSARGPRAVPVRLRHDWPRGRGAGAAVCRTIPESTPEAPMAATASGPSLSSRAPSARSPPSVTSPSPPRTSGGRCDA